MKHMYMHTHTHIHQLDYYDSICNQSEQLKGPRRANIANYTFSISLISKHENTKGKKARFFHSFFHSEGLSPMH